MSWELLKSRTIARSICLLINKETSEFYIGNEVEIRNPIIVEQLHPGICVVDGEYFISIAPDIAMIEVKREVSNCKLHIEQQDLILESINNPTQIHTDKYVVYVVYTYYPGILLGLYSRDTNRVYNLIVGHSNIGSIYAGEFSLEENAGVLKWDEAWGSSMHYFDTVRDGDYDKIIKKAMRDRANKHIAYGNIDELMTIEEVIKSYSSHTILD